ncbi:MAG: magnesium chelatase, partial [Acidimicrobiales bacterium]
PGGEDPVRAAMAAAGAVRAAGVAALVVDCEGGTGPRLGLARALAAAMGARHVGVGEVTAEDLASAVRLAVAGSPARPSN